METTKVAISAFVDSHIHEVLKGIADKEGRSLTKQVTKILTSYVESNDWDSGS